MINERVTASPYPFVELKGYRNRYWLKVTSIIVTLDGLSGAQFMSK